MALTITLREFLSRWADWSYYCNIETFTGLCVSNSPLREVLASTINSNITPATLDQLIRLIPTTWLIPDGAANREVQIGSLVRLQAWDKYSGQPALVVYSNRVNGVLRFKGMMMDGKVPDIWLPVTTGADALLTAGTPEFNRFYTTFLGGVLSNNMDKTLAEILVLGATSSSTATETALLAEVTPEMRAKQLAKISFGMGCQKLHVAQLFKALGEPDPKPYLDTQDFEYTAHDLRFGNMVVLNDSPDQVRMICWVGKKSADSSDCKCMDSSFYTSPAWITIDKTTARAATPAEAVVFLTALVTTLLAKFASIPNAGSDASVSASVSAAA